VKRAWVAAVQLAVLALTTSAWSADGTELLKDAQSYYREGQYFKASRYAFAAGEADPKLQAEAYSWMALGLARAGLYNASSYFFIRTLQSGQKPLIQRVLVLTQDLLMRVGGDVLRKYLIRHTAYEDYDAVNRSAYLYALGKDALLDGNEAKAIGYFNGMSAQSSLWPFALQLRASSEAIQNRTDEAIRDYRACADRADQIVQSAREESGGEAPPAGTRESEDLRARCQAGEARTLYQLNRFHEAERAYDRVPKASFVWTDILFEQAWNAFAQGEYNRALGKLVSYKSPALEFVHNSEIDVLRAQSFLALCLYGDANEVINEFNAKYAKTGEQAKLFVERNATNLPAFYDAGREALKAPLHTRNDFHRLMNRFIRGPYFQNLVAAEKAVDGERQAARQFGQMLPGANNAPGRGFPGFLDQVLKWRTRSIQLLGGAFVKNSLIDYHAAMIADFEKIAFIKLEMLSRAKAKLLRAQSGEERARGNVIPSRRDDQYYWSFNGEFWNDELGDYVFGLESECGASS
jgi:hypothetical protein